MKPWLTFNFRWNAEKDKKSVNESEIALVVLWVKLQDVHTKEMCNWNMVLVTFSAVSDKLLEICVVPKCSIYV